MRGFFAPLLSPNKQRLPIATTSGQSYHAGISTSPRVLIVDDEPDTATTLAMLLTAAALAATQIVTDARLALDAFAEFHPHVVLLDIGMPGLDGYELCRSIRGFPAAQAVMIIVVSGFDRPESKAKAIEAGANYYFVKPADPERLIELVKLAGIASD